MEIGPNNELVLSENLKFLLLITIHELNHWSTDKVIMFMNQCWGNQHCRAAKSAYLACSICPEFNPGEPICTAPGYFNLPFNRPFEVWQMNFIQLPPSHEYKYVLVMVCMFSH